MFVFRPKTPRTRELRDYFVESGIAALLDAPIFVGADALGVVCHEDAGEPRTWTAKEQAFAASVAQLAANSVAANRWRLREEALRRSEARYRSMVQDVTDYVVRSDHTGRILHVNSAVGVAHGTDPDELRGSTVFDMAPPGEHHIFLDAVRATTPESPVARYCHHVLHNDGSQGLVEWASRTFFGEDGKPTGYRAIGRDITEQRKREESLREAQRLEALALFAGGMAHDLNNLLLPILVLTDSVLAGLGPDSPESEDLREVSRAAIRARSLVRQVLMFARPADGPARDVLSVAPYVREAVDFVRTVAPASVEFEVDIPSDCGRVSATSSDIVQIFSNLCTNAVQAMPNGGRLHIAARVDDDADEVCVDVSDTGEGIPKSLATRIYEPFVTTKPIGKGTGLGLSVTRSLVEELDGRISFESTEGRGTRFTVVFPLLAGASAPVEKQQGTVTPLRGTERVLIIDDEPVVVRAVAVGLERLGYEVVTEATPSVALARLERESFDIVVTDFAMPEMSGVDVATRIRKEHACLPIILMSGGVVSDLQDSLVDGLVQKPFLVDEFAASLRAVIDGRSSVSEAARE